MFKFIFFLPSPDESLPSDFVVEEGHDRVDFGKQCPVLFLPRGVQASQAAIAVVWEPSVGNYGAELVGARQVLEPFVATATACGVGYHGNSSGMWAEQEPIIIDLLSGVRAEVSLYTSSYSRADYDEVYPYLKKATSSGSVYEMDRAKARMARHFEPKLFEVGTAILLGLLPKYLSSDHQIPNPCNDKLTQDLFVALKARQKLGRQSREGEIDQYLQEQQDLEADEELNEVIDAVQAIVHETEVDKVASYYEALSSRLMSLLNSAPPAAN
jgi:hypothetical protein